MQYAGQEIFDHDIHSFGISSCEGTITAEHATFEFLLEVEDGTAYGLNVHCWPNHEEHGDLIGPCTEKQYDLSERIAESLGLDEWCEWAEEYKRNPF